jgi:hypothetical protein
MEVAIMKKPTAHMAIALTVIALAGLLAIPTVALSRYGPPAGNAGSNPAASCIATPLPAAASGTAVTSQVAADLAYMREEEKLARDVYNELAQKWGTATFSNIARSEQRHTDTIAALLSRYGAADPAANKAAGTYADPALQKLHDDLIARGSKSLTEALEVGKLIEQTDIADLDKRIARTTQSDIVAAYTNLRAGSENHLSAFSRRLAGGGTGVGPGAGSGAGAGLGAGGGRGGGGQAGMGRMGGRW